MSLILLFAAIFSLLVGTTAGDGAQAASAPTANTLSLTNHSGGGLRNYPLQFGRPFLQGAIANFPRVLIDGVPTETQADVKNRYPDGSVKFAVIAVVIPSLPPGKPVRLTFANETSGNNAPLSRDEMLDPKKFDFDAAMSLSEPGQPSQTVSARDMLAHGAYKLWTSGPVAQTVEIADDSADATYDIGFDGAHHPFRPRFYATFWPLTHQVQVRYVGEAGKTTELADLSYDLTLTIGEDRKRVYAIDLTGTGPNKKKHWALTNWTKCFWLAGAPPAQVDIDPNIAYLASTRFIPNYDPAVTAPESELAAYYSQWSSYPHDPYDAYYNHPLGNVVWTQTMGQVGGRPEVGPYPIWSLLWLYTGDWRMRQFALGMADLATAFPANLRETKTGKRLLRTDPVGSSTGLGHTVAVTDRKSITWGAYWFVNSGGFAVADRVGVAGPINLTPPFTFDMPHQPSPFYLQYLLTGDPFYLNEMYLWAGATAMMTPGDATVYPYGRGPTGAEGAIKSEIRGDGWGIRNRAETAFIAPDADPEKAYFTALTNDALARWEGGFNITGTAYQGTTMWNWGRQQGVANIPGAPLAGTIPTLHAWETLCPAPYDHTCAETNNANYGPTAASTLSPWMHYYLMYGLARAKELGFAAGPLFSYSAEFLTGIVNDSGMPQMAGIYRIPNVLTPGAWATDWSSVLNAFSPTYRATGITTDFSNGLSQGGNSYTAPASAAAALALDEARGAQSWAWFKQNVYPSVTGGSLGPDPRWPIVPRTDSNELPAVPVE